MDLPKLDKIDRCWVCGDRCLRPVHQAGFDLASFAVIDPEMLQYDNVRFNLLACKACGFIQPEGLPRLPSFFDRLYTPYHDMQLHAEDKLESDDGEAMMARDFDEGSKDLIFRRILAGIRRHKKVPGNRLLDIGAHVGRLLWLAKHAGWTPEGLEVNRKTAEFAHRRTGADVFAGSVADLGQISPNFDAITIVDVLEHIPHPVSLLRELHSHITPGGAIAVKVPCGPGQLVKEWVRSRFSKAYEFTIARNMYHVNHFGPRSLKLALENAGFEAVHFEPSPPEVFRSFTPRNAIKMLSSNIGRILHYSLCSLPYFRTCAPLNFHLMAFARRPSAGKRISR